MAGYTMPHHYPLMQRSINRLVTHMRVSIAHSDFEIELRKTLPQDGYPNHMTQDVFWPYVAEELYAMMYKALGSEDRMLDYEFFEDRLWCQGGAWHVQFLKTFQCYLWQLGNTHFVNGKLYQWLEKYANVFKKNIEPQFAPGHFEDLYLSAPWE